MPGKETAAMNADPTAKALGRKVAFYRELRGLTQRDLAAMIDRSGTWVSQVERGVRKVDRMTVLRTVAEALAGPFGAQPLVVGEEHQVLAQKRLRTLTKFERRLALEARSER